MHKIILFVLAFLALGLAACATIPTGSASMQQISIDASEFKFEPAMIEVAAGRPARIMMRNKGAIEHDWAIMKVPMVGLKESSTGSHNMAGMNEPELHMNAMMGQTAQVEFTPTTPGTYDIYCTVMGHKEAGMVGKLVVK
jgi:uncharacterized cupredoxin-like copper-binding protein